jgi:CubicO group peptidase (beta-lactamase class C family)
VCGVIRDGETVFAKAYGMANLELNVPLSTRSVFSIASVSKQFTAASIALLALEGKLDFDADIHTYLPEMGDLGAPVTVRQLVHHTSGIRQHLEMHWLVGWYDRDYFNNERVYQLLTQQKGLNFEPGSRHQYSNSNYVLLAEIVERVSGQSLREFTDANIFAPLGMEHTRFDDDYRQIAKNRATGYWRRRDGGYERVLKSFDGYGDIGLITTIGDLAKWDSNFYDPRVGGDAFLELIHTRGVLDNGDTLDYASGLRHGSYRGLPTVSHGGGFRGFKAHFIRFPEQRFSIIVLCNAGSASPERLARQVIDLSLAPALGPATPIASSRDSLIELTESELQKFTGFYWNPVNRYAQRITMSDGALVVGSVAGNTTYQLGPIGARRFTVLNAPVHVELEFDDDAERGSVTMGSGTPTVMERFEPVSPTETELDAYVGTYVSDEGLADMRVSREDDALRIHIMEGSPRRLHPLMADHFEFDLGSVAFERSGRHVSGLVIDMGRLSGLRFTKGD